MFILVSNPYKFQNFEIYNPFFYKYATVHLFGTRSQKKLTLDQVFSHPPLPHCVKRSLKEVADE